MHDQPRRALITGITGQDGSYLAELLLEKGYEVYGLVRRSSSFNTSRLEHLSESSDQGDGPLHLLHGDLSDASSLNYIVKTVRPDEIYNLAAQSHVKVSFDAPEYTGDITGLGVTRLLEAIRSFGLVDTRFYQASSSELFGKAVDSPQTETTPFYPRSPYAAAKAYAFHITRNYRESFDMFAVNGILFNHESPRRGEAFVTRKISRAAARIKLDLQDTLLLGNLHAKRDWGFAGDFVEAMWLMLQASEPEDFVIATGAAISVREFCDYCFGKLDMPLEWSGHGVDEVGVGPDGRVLVQVDPSYFRPAEVSTLKGDASKAKQLLGWSPKVTVSELASMMVEADLELAAGEKAQSTRGASVKR